MTKLFIYISSKHPGVEQTTPALFNFCLQLPLVFPFSLLFWLRKTQMVETFTQCSSCFFLDHCSPQSLCHNLFL